MEQPTLLQRLRDIFNTVEGWAVGIALLWIFLSKQFGWAQNIDTGAGIISPAILLTIAGPFVLAKLGWTVPFQTVKANTTQEARVEEPGKTTVSLAIPIAFALAVVFAAGAATADPREPGSRFSIGAEVGAQWLSSDVHQSELGVAPLGYVTFNASELATLATSYQRDVTHNFGSVRVGGRARLAELGRARLYAGVDYVNYHGEGASWIKHKNDAEFSFTGSAPVLSHTDEKTWRTRTVVWIVGKASLNPQQDEHPITGWRLALRFQGAGGTP